MARARSPNADVMAEGVDVRTMPLRMTPLLYGGSHKCSDLVFRITSHDSILLPILSLIAALIQYRETKAARTQMRCVTGEVA